MIDGDWIRALFATVIQLLLDSLAQDHFDALTQEPPLTARAGERLEGARINGLPEGFTFKIITLDIPDRGAGALEKKSGTDLYVGIEVTFDGVRKSKGFLVQAKWDRPRLDAETKRLSEQCRKMLDMSDSAYVWAYGEEGITVQDAQDFTGAADGVSAPRTIGDLFNSVLQCNEGDQELGLPIAERPRVALGDMLERLRVPSGIAFEIEADSGGPPPSEVTLLI